MTSYLLQSFTEFVHEHPFFGVFGSLLLIRPSLYQLGIAIPSNLASRHIIEYKGPVFMFMFRLALILECVLLITLLFLIFGPFANLQHFPSVDAFLDLSVIIAITCGPIAFYRLSRHQFLPFREVWLWLGTLQRYTQIWFEELYYVDRPGFPYKAKEVRKWNSYIVTAVLVPVAWIILKIVLLALLILVFSLEGLLILLGALIAIAFYVVLERKLIGAIQRRRGPNVVGFWGVAQSLADGLKLLSKEVLVPAKANRFLFIFAPLLAIVLSLAIFAILPISPYSWLNFINTDIDILILFALSSFGVYGVVLAGWSSNSKYAFLGALRSASQIISYEVFFSIILLSVFTLTRSASIVEVVYVQSQTIWYIVPCFPLAVIFFIALLAETNRSPFDLPEAEAELVAGFNIEYSSILFALFFLGEYGNMFALSYLFVLLFLGGWLPFFGLPHLPFGLWAVIKTLVVASIFIVVRANVPRYRYDQLIGLGWKILLPFTFSCFLFTAIVSHFI